MNVRIAIAMVLSLGLVGCIAPSDEAFVGESYAQANYAPPINDGSTTRAEIVARLGPPSYEFEGGRLMTYRLMLVDREADLNEQDYLQALAAFRNSMNLYARRAELAKSGKVWVVGPESEQERQKLFYSRAAEYSLVVALDGRGVVTRHAFRRIQP